MRALKNLLTDVDYVLFGSMLLLSCAGLVTMYTFSGENTFFERQIVWLVLAVVVFFLAFIPDYRFLRTGNTTFLLYLGILALLVLVLFFGEVTLGAQSRFDIGIFSIQPSDPAKLVLIAVLAKYFSKRHELIGDFRHILVSGAYAVVIFGLVFVQPDFGSAIILFFIWLGMILVAGISWKHLLLVFFGGFLVVAGLWFAPVHTVLGTEEPLLKSYQKQRILTFLDPLADLQGTGYNAYQSMIAVGSGQLLGKGVGYGTQSKLEFLPEYETDFIFAAFAEEWGFLGVLILFLLFGVVIVRLVQHALSGASNFEKLFASGVAILIISHFFVHVGMNVGLLPVTGTTIPFLSYGGSHLITEFLAVGMVVAMGRYSKRRYEAGELIP